MTKQRCRTEEKKSNDQSVKSVGQNFESSYLSLPRRNNILKFASKNHEKPSQDRLCPAQDSMSVP